MIFICTALEGKIKEIKTFFNKATKFYLNLNLKLIVLLAVLIVLLTSMMDNIKYHSNLPQKQLKDLINQGLNIMYMNTRSIAGKMEDIEYQVSELEVEIPLLVFAETWLSSDSIQEKKKRLVGFQDYQAYHNFRLTGMGGGIAIFVHRSIKSRQIDEYNIDNVQFLVVELLSLNIKLAACYRPPNYKNLDTFFNGLNTILQRHKNLILVGDMNIDLLVPNNILNTYQNTISSSFFKIINQINQTMGTRRTESSNTLIDHMISDLNQNILKYFITNDNCLSDHRMIVLNLDLKSNINSIHSKQIKVIDYDQLTKTLPSISTSNFEDFHQQLIDAVNSNTKFITLKSSKSQKKPWYDTELKKVGKMRDKFYKLRNNFPSNTIISQKFKTYQRLFRKLIKQKKRDFYEGKFKDHSKNSKMMWKLANEVIYNRSVGGTENLSLIIDGKEITDDKTLAESFNRHFLQAGSSPIPNFAPSKIDRLVPESVNFSKFSHVSSSEIATIINQLKNTSAGFDKIKSIFLKNNLVYFTSVLPKLINEILDTGKYPDTLKISRVKPIPKKGSSAEISNYRPISVTSIFSKILETVMKNQLLIYLNANSLIDKMQFGFTNSSSTTSAAINVIDGLVKNLENGLVTGSLFIDISNAFNCLNFEQQKNILEACGICGDALDLIMSYFTDRTQFVEINEFISEILKLIAGLPQGSCLPILFLLYVNGLLKLKLHGRLALYADDAVVSYGAVDYPTLKRQMTEDLLTIKKFLETLNMQLNYKKTKFMIFKGQKKSLFEEIECDTEKICRVEVFNYLGLEIDSNLTFHKHAVKVLRSISQVAGLIHRVKHFLNRRALLNIYFAHVHSKLLYLLPVWGSTSLNMTDKIQRMQCRILKNIYKKPIRFSTNEFFKNVVKRNILMFSQLVDSESCILVYKIKNGLIHTASTIPSNNEITNRLTRSAHLLRPPGYLSNIGQKSFYHRGVTTYNNIENRIKNSPTIKEFKFKLNQKYRNSILI